MRILIADDDRTSTMLLGRTLEQWGFEVIVAHDGTDRLGATSPATIRRRWPSSTG